MVNISPALWEQLKKVPALPPPPGVTSNLENREVPNHFEWIITATLGFTFTTILILIRIYTKFFIIKSHGWEDCKLLTYSPSLPASIIYKNKNKKRPLLIKFIDRYIGACMGTSFFFFLDSFFASSSDLFLPPSLIHSFIHFDERERERERVGGRGGRLVWGWKEVGLIEFLKQKFAYCTYRLDLSHTWHTMSNVSKPVLASINGISPLQRLGLLPRQASQLLPPPPPTPTWMEKSHFFPHIKRRSTNERANEHWHDRERERERFLGRDD